MSLTNAEIFLPIFSAPNPTSSLSCTDTRSHMINYVTSSQNKQTHSDTHTHTQIHMYSLHISHKQHAHTHTHTHTYLHTCTHTHTHTYPHTHTQMQFLTFFIHTVSLGRCALLTPLCWQFLASLLRPLAKDLSLFLDPLLWTHCYYLSEKHSVLQLLKWNLRPIFFTCSSVLKCKCYC